MRNKFIAGVIAFAAGCGFASAQGDNAQNEIIGNWMYKCDEGPCQVFLSLADDTTGETRLTWSFLYNAENDQLSAILNLPLGVAIPPGVRIAISASDNLNWPYQVCDEIGCRAVAIIDGATSTKFSDAEKVSVQFIPYGGKYAGSFDVPMEGFSAARAKLIANARKASDAAKKE